MDLGDCQDLQGARPVGCHQRLLLACLWHPGTALGTAAHRVLPLLGAQQQPAQSRRLPCASPQRTMPLSSVPAPSCLRPCGKVGVQAAWSGYEGRVLPVRQSYPPGLR